MAQKDPIYLAVALCKEKRELIDNPNNDLYVTFDLLISQIDPYHVYILLLYYTFKPTEFKESFNKRVTTMLNLCVENGIKIKNVTESLYNVNWGETERKRLKHSYCNQKLSLKLSIQHAIFFNTKFTTVENYDITDEDIETVLPLILFCDHIDKIQLFYYIQGLIAKEEITLKRLYILVNILLSFTHDNMILSYITYLCNIDFKNERDIKEEEEIVRRVIDKNPKYSKLLLNRFSENINFLNFIETRHWINNTKNVISLLEFMKEKRETASLEFLIRTNKNIPSFITDNDFLQYVLNFYPETKSKLMKISECEGMGHPILHYLLMYYNDRLLKTIEYIIQTEPYMIYLVNIKGFYPYDIAFSMGVNDDVLDKLVYSKDSLNIPGDFCLSHLQKVNYDNITKEVVSFYVNNMRQIDICNFLSNLMILLCNKKTVDFDIVIFCLEIGKKNELCQKLLKIVCKYIKSVPYKFVSSIFSYAKFPVLLDLFRILGSNLKSTDIIELIYKEDSKGYKLLFTYLESKNYEISVFYTLKDCITLDNIIDYGIDYVCDIVAKDDNLLQLFAPIIPKELCINPDTKHRFIDRYLLLTEEPKENILELLDDELCYQDTLENKIAKTIRNSYIKKEDLEDSNLYNFLIQNKGLLDNFYIAPSIRKCKFCDTEEPIKSYNLACCLSSVDTNCLDIITKFNDCGLCSHPMDIKIIRNKYFACVFKD